METLNKEDVSDQLVASLARESSALSQQEDQAITRYADSKINDQPVRSFLAAHTTPGPTDLTLQPSDAGIQLFGRLKEKIQKIFCETVNGLDVGKPEDIIKGVLLALIPAFTGGLPAVLLPIVIGLVALLLKKGFAAVCPV